MPYPFSLAQQTSRKAGRPGALRTGTVLSVSSEGVMVDVAGGQVLAGVVAGAAAGVAPGATVSVFKQDSSWQVQGATAGGGSGVTNATILPAVPNSGQAGSILGSTTTNLVAALGSGSGTVFANRSITVTLPKGHLCEITCRSITTVCTVAAFTTVLTLRDNNNPAGTSRGQTVAVNPVAGNVAEWDVSGYLIGDGAVHQFGLCAAAVTGGGSVTISQQAGSPLFMGVFDWGDATGVTVI